MRTLQVRAEEFERLAQVDPLTGLSNRRVAEERLSAEASRSKRTGHPLTVVFFDLNEFKHINDTYGHLAGDLVLKHFGNRLQSAIRKSDTAARMGGDEFLILLPDCTTSQVQILISRLRPMELAWGGIKIPISFSAGWVGYDKEETTEEFLERADRILYAEKRSGKVVQKEATGISRHEAPAKTDLSSAIVSL
jgi:diguanylate cyclase (GGDEF)-like protein